MIHIVILRSKTCFSLQKMQKIRFQKKKLRQHEYIVKSDFKISSSKGGEWRVCSREYIFMGYLTEHKVGAQQGRLIKV